MTNHCPPRPLCLGLSLCLALFTAMRGQAAEGAAPAPLPALQPRADLPRPEFMDAPAPLPNYVPNARWGTQAEPIRTMQKPLSPAQSAKHFVTQEGFEITQFAAEPEILKPLWLAWDERGRLWIAESVDYPNDLQPMGQGNDRLKICEDTNGDGRADKFTIFADKLSIPTGFVFANGGVIVIHSGVTEFLEDKNGDDKADERKVLFSGWGMHDTHATASNLRYGFDNWIWGVVGYSGFNGTVGGKQLRFGQGIFRFKPDGSALEFVRSSNNNTWGLGFSEEGLVFGSTANGNASMYMPIPNRYYEAVGGWSAARLESIADNQAIHPITKTIRQVDWHDKFTAGAGSALYTARNFPREYWNRAQFVTEPTGHLIAKFDLQPKGADFVAYNQHNFAASDDEWAAPIAAEVGPDGALWVIDWYNYIIQHNPVPNGFQNGRGNAYDTPLRDKTHGRLYRIAWKQARPVPKIDLWRATPQQLLATLKNDNLLWRLHAQRLLVQRGNKDVVPALTELVKDQGLDALGLSPGPIHALWTLKGLGVLETVPVAASAGSAADQRAHEEVVAALKHSSAAVRRAAVETLPRTGESAAALVRANLLADRDAQVRLAAFLAFSEMPASDMAGLMISTALQRPENAGDRWIRDAATSAAARHDAPFLQALLSNVQLPPADTTDPAGLAREMPRLARRVATHYAQRAPLDTVFATLGAARGADKELTAAVLSGLAAGWPEGKGPVFNSDNLGVIFRLMDSLPESSQDLMISLAQRWGKEAIFDDRTPKIIEGLRQQITDKTTPEERRVAAANRLLSLEDKMDNVRLLLGQVDLLSPPSLSAGLLGVIPQSRQAEVGAAVLGHFPKLTPAARRAAITTLTRRNEWAVSLLDAVEKGPLNKTDLAPEQWVLLRQNPDPVIAERARVLQNAGMTISQDQQKTFEKLLPLAREKGDAARGKEVFAAMCAVCHLFNGEGGKIGPDLTGIGSRDRADVLLEIVDPNRSVESNYRLWTAKTKGGDTVSGRLDAETQTSVEITDITGHKHVIQRADLAELEASPISIMPVGFEAIPAEDLKGLLEYLAQPKS